MTLVLIESVLFAVRTTLFLELRLALPATVLVAVMLLAPQAARITLGGVADEARLARSRMVVSSASAASRCGLGRSLEFRVTKVALVLIEPVLFAVEPPLLF
jgi:hypothetical protein